MKDLDDTTPLRIAYLCDFDPHDRNIYSGGNAQMERLRPFFPKSRGMPRVDDRRVLSGIIYVQKNGLQWKDAPAVYRPPKTLYNRFVRWSRMGVFARIFTELA